MVRGIKGLEDCFSYTIVHPTWRKTKDDPEDKHCGWVFGDPDGEPFTNTIGLGGPFPPAHDGNEPNPFFKAFSIREVYEKVGDKEGKYTVPILWDKKKETIVSNESSEIIQMLNSEFNQFARNPDLDLESTDLKEKMDAVDPWIYDSLNNGMCCKTHKSTSAYFNGHLIYVTGLFSLKLLSFFFATQASIAVGLLARRRRMMSLLAN
jgi:putative glutathione S-transferase